MSKWKGINYLQSWGNHLGKHILKKANIYMDLVVVDVTFAYVIIYVENKVCDEEKK